MVCRFFGSRVAAGQHAGGHRGEQRQKEIEKTSENTLPTRYPSIKQVASLADPLGGGPPDPLGGASDHLSPGIARAAVSDFGGGPPDPLGGALDHLSPGIARAAVSESDARSDRSLDTPAGNARTVASGATT